MIFIKKILNKEKIDEKKVWEFIVKAAKEAVESPRIGRDISTTQFYQHILNIIGNNLEVEQVKKGLNF